MIIFAFGLILMACSGDRDEIETQADPNNVIGKWLLIETLMDPGDGSGVYQSVQSNETITFNNNGTFTSSEGMCNGEEKTGTFDLDNLIITPSNCTFTYTFKLEGSNLILHPPCIEACGLKYKKISDNSAVD